MRPIAEPSRKDERVIPAASWQAVPLGEVVEINPRPEKLPDEMLASFVPMKCVEEESGRFTPIEDRRVKDVRKRYTPFRDGDVLFAKVTPCMENGKAAIVKGLTNGIGFGSTELFALRPTGKLLQKLLFYFVIQESFRRSAAANMTGAVGLRRVPKTYLAEQIIPLPPLPEQRRIVAEIEKQFTRLDAGVAALRRTQANLKRYRAAVLKAACEGCLVPTEAELARKEALFGGSIPKHDFGSSSRGTNPSINRGSIPREKVHRSTPVRSTNFETGEQLLARILTERRKNWNGRGQYKDPVVADTSDLPLLPKDWAWASLDQLLSLMRNGISAKPDAESGLPILRISAVRALSVNLTETRHLNATLDDYPDYALTEGDLLFTRYNGNPELVGVCGVVPTITSPIVHPDKLIRCELVPTGALPDYIAITANVGVSRNYLAKRIRTTAGQAGISGGDLKGLPIPLAPLAEQKRIVVEVERRLSVAAELEKVVAVNLKRAARLRQSVLQCAFSPPITRKL